MNISILIGSSLKCFNIFWIATLRPSSCGDNVGVTDGHDFEPDLFL